MDTVENILLSITTVLTVITIYLGFGTYVFAIFAANLDNAIFLEPISGVFMKLTVITTGFTIFGTVATIYYLKLTGVLAISIIDLHKFPTI